MRGHYETVIQRLKGQAVSRTRCVGRVGAAARMTLAGIGRRRQVDVLARHQRPLECVRDYSVWYRDTCTRLLFF